jgi:hypothetical protein
MGLGSDETPIADLGFLCRKKFLAQELDMLKTSVGNSDQKFPGAPWASSFAWFSSGLKTYSDEA